MKQILTICTLLISTNIFAQEFAYIQDSDGYCNIRNFNNIKQIDTQLKNSTLVFCFLNQSSHKNWMNVNYRDKNNELQRGYIYSDSLVIINDHNFKKISVTETKDHIVKLSSENITITATEEAFNPTGKTFLYYKDHPEMIEKINDKEYYGMDGGVPTTQYHSIKIEKAGKSFTIPEEGLDNLYEPNLKKTLAHYDENSDTLYIESFNSDGAGSYAVIWRIEKGIYKDRFIFYGF